MISAEEARKLVQDAEVNSELLERVESEVKRLASEGFTDCVIVINKLYPSTTLHNVGQILTNLGYGVDINIYDTPECKTTIRLRWR